MIADHDRQSLIDIINSIALAGEYLQNKSQAVPWKQIIGMRNIMIHQYDRVDLKLVWDTVTIAFPKLAQSLQPYLST